MGTIKQRPVVAILVGGGPAPGINSVIGAATIRSILGGCDVIGIRVVNPKKVSPKDAL